LIFSHIPVKCEIVSLFIPVRRVIINYSEYILVILGEIDCVIVILGQDLEKGQGK
jgi:hypothetical protein